MNIGDRYQYIYSKEIWEITKIYAKHVDLINIESGNLSATYEIKLLTQRRLFNYLGNFSKSKNFSNLWSILSE